MAPSNAVDDSVVEGVLVDAAVIVVSVEADPSVVAPSDVPAEPVSSEESVLDVCADTVLIAPDDVVTDAASARFVVSVAVGAVASDETVEDWLTAAPSSSEIDGTAVDETASETS